MNTKQGLFLLFLAYCCRRTSSYSYARTVCTIVRNVRPSDFICWCSNTKKWNLCEILSQLKKKKHSNWCTGTPKMKKFASQIMYTCSVVKNPDENPVSLMTELTTEHVYIIRRSEFLHFRGSCASIFVIFSLKVNGIFYFPELVPGSKSTFTSRNFTFSVHVAIWWWNKMWPVPLSWVHTLVTRFEQRWGNQHSLYTGAVPW